MKFLSGILLALTLCTPAFADSEAEAVLNNFRAGQGLAGLSTSLALEESAQAHVQDMVQGGFFSHSGSDGSSFSDRARAWGYQGCPVGENIAKGQGSVDAVIQSWAESPGHRANMLNQQATEFGLVRGPDNLWVLVLGQSGC